jgi:hypothetical protein
MLALSLLALLVAAAACDYKKPLDTGKEIKTVSVANISVTLSNPSGQIKHGGDEFFISFKDSSGKLIDPGSASINFHMASMGSMPAMNEPASLTMTSTPGICRAKANVDMAGEWQVQVSVEGPAGKGQTSFPIAAQ